PSLLDEIGSVSNITLSSMRYTREDISSFRSRVKELAMQDAISKGNVYALSAGLELGRALTITDYSSEPVMREADFAMAKSAMVMADAPTQISTGDISVSASVNVVFAMK
ncbi:MAG: SIMPL domain-containing protein, partial [Sphaerochaetaceae bacterium]|nr:SIMPL domain-containing protein [Sphaerochaetaceae bacterium]